MTEFLKSYSSWSAFEISSRSFLVSVSPTLPLYIYNGNMWSSHPQLLWEIALKNLLQDHKEFSLKSDQTP